MEQTQETAPSADAGVSLETAVERLDSGASTERQSQPETEQPSQQTVEQSAGEEQPETEPEAQEALHGNSRTRLRDGTEVTIAELKKAYGDRQDFTRQRQEFDAQQRTFRDREAKIQQQEAFFKQSIDTAVALVQARMPQMPDVALRDSDPFEYYRMADDYNRAAAQLHQLASARQAHAEQARNEHQARQREFENAEREALKDALPVLKTESGFKTFREEVTKFGKEYGFSPEELSGVIDHRMFVVLNDAIAWRKLQAAKPAAMEKAKDAPPVQSPSARRSEDARSAQSREEGIAKLRKSGSIDDALSILNSMN